jgi:hypothetical protein
MTTFVEEALSIEEYLLREPGAEFRSEFLGGVVYPMTGGSPARGSVSSTTAG